MKIVSINKTLLNAIGDTISIYGCNSEIEKLLELDTDNRIEMQNKATSIVEIIMKEHGKNKLRDYISELAKVEYNLSSLGPDFRDHVVHSVLCFILGAYINEKYLNPIHKVRVDEFQWKLAALFHDIGYPVELAKRKILDEYLCQINELFKEYNVDIKNNTLSFEIVLKGFFQLSSGNALDLIQEQIKKWKLKIDADSAYKTMTTKGQICHGIISSLTLLCTMDKIYQLHNPNKRREETYEGDLNKRIDWNYKNFEEDIVQVCTAIFIHNLREEHFKEAKIELKYAPLAFLLKLSDCLQDWDRPGKNKDKVYKASQFDIEVVKDKLILVARIPEERKKALRDELNLYLAGSHVNIE